MFIIFNIKLYQALLINGVKTQCKLRMFFCSSAMRIYTYSSRPPYSPDGREGGLKYQLTYFEA